MSKSCAQIWFEEEGDSYFERNQRSLNPHEDLIIELIRLYKLSPQKILEIGAANGWRLAQLVELFGCEALAVEPSSKAIEDGKRRFPKVKFFRSLGEDISFSAQFDLIIVNFVFHWVARENLLKFVQKIDQALLSQGYLIIGDFGTNCFLKRRYHHREDVDLYTWKMDYGYLFSSTGQYLELARLRYDYDSKTFKSEISQKDMATLWLFRKTDCHLEIP